MSAGPALIDVLGTALADEDRRRLLHPACGGVILFARNYENPPQLGTLVREIRTLRGQLLVCVDHEGGRVQRFRSGFTALPPMRRLGELWDRDREAGRRAARAVGVVIATELAAHGIDFSFTPVLDLEYGRSDVIGDRALHTDPDAVGELGAELVRGLAACGVAAVGKHFPGHGYAKADSHTDMPLDDRPLAEIWARDIAPYRATIAAGLAGVMPAHVIYAQVDPAPAGYSRLWLQEVLRGQLGFGGLIFSDDLSMAGAGTAGGVPERARAALAAGCDMVLHCNDPAGQERLLESLGGVAPVAVSRVARMRMKEPGDLRSSTAYRKALAEVGRFA